VVFLRNGAVIFVAAARKVNSGFEQKLMTRIFWRFYIILSNPVLFTCGEAPPELAAGTAALRAQGGSGAWLCS